MLVELYLLENRNNFDFYLGLKMMNTRLKHTIRLEDVLSNLFTDCDICDNITYLRVSNIFPC